MSNIFPASGNTGIGTTSPGTNLEVFGTDAEMMVHYVGNSRGGFRAMATQRLAILTTSSSDNLVFGYETDFKSTFTERMRINNSTGNIGIGTSSPSSTLHVTRNENQDNIGTIRYENNNTGTGSSTNAQLLGVSKYGCAQYMVWEDKGMRIGMRSIGAVACGAGELYFTTCNDTTQMVIKNNGNVGIGTTSPTNLIHGYKASGTATLALQVGGNYGYFFMNGCCMAIGSDSGASGIKFHISRQAPDDSLLITNTGKVSVGSTAPNGQLTVAADQSSNNQHFNIIGTQASYCQEYSFGIPTSTKDLRIYDGTAGATRFTLTSDGNIGIGTPAPGSKLVVCGGAAGDASNIRIISTNCYGGYVAYNGASLRTTIGYGDDGNIFTGATAQSMAIRSENAMHFGANGNCLIMTLTSGRIGVGTISPSYKLHVNGTFYAAGSSQDYKEGICQYNTDSCLFMCLKPKTYQYKDEWKHLGKDLKSETQIGLIAEEVAESHPELAILVNEENEKVVRNVDYEKLSIVLLAEVQKLRQEVDQLKNK